MKQLILKMYNEKVEDFCTRLLYFFNTIDSYCIIAGAISFFLYNQGKFSPIHFLIITVLVFLVYKLSDFYPFFIACSSVFLFFLLRSGVVSLNGFLSILLINLWMFALIQFLFMGIPDSIVARDPTIGIRKIWNSIFTIASTTVSMPISLFFSTLYSLILIVRPGPESFNGLLFWITFFVAAAITYRLKPKTFSSKDFKPPVDKPVAQRVILLNIDGCRLDRFYEAKLDFLTSLQKEATYFTKGLLTVYKAFTNPAFASILTGAPPQRHGIKTNNIGQSIKIEGLPDIVKTRLYGSMHIKHFAKKNWQTNIVSLPTHGIYNSDDVMFDCLKRDLLNKDQTRLFIADISEADFLGHAYGSESRQYLDALKRADKRIKGFFDWMKHNDLFSNTVIIICSDHGIVRIDHAYLLFNAEKYVPCMLLGEKIKKNNPLFYKASIMDIALTISYVLGIRYPSGSQGRVFIEAIDTN